ncbi:MAG: TonB-dependent receptor [Akkermansiaceae bacterium]
MDDYLLVDLTGYYRVSDNVVFRGGVKNLLDQEYVLWSRANRGAGHGGGVSNSRDTQPGINAFVSLEFEF